MISAFVEGSQPWLTFKSAIVQPSADFCVTFFVQFGEDPKEIGHCHWLGKMYARGAVSIM